MAVVAVLALLAPVSAQAAPQLGPAAARAALPSDRLHFGLANSPGTDFNWLVSSGVPWHYRYQYLAGGVNTGGVAGDPCGANAGWQTWNSPAGQFVTDYIASSVGQKAIPVFSYYEIVQSNPSAGVESAELTKISTVCTMQAYWADFTVLMQKVGASGAQVVVHVEPDFWGFMEHQSADPTTLAAVVASSNNPDLAGLPNTVAGMGLAFLKLRDKYAPSALLAIHASSWGSGVDIASDQRTTVDAAAEADKVVAFIDKAGLVGNPLGITPWDVIFNDVADHDAGYSANWWDRNNVVFPNFTRWLAFMSRMHTATGLPLIEWQVPVGNQYFDTMNNTDGHYQDNRAEYFTAHPSQLTGAGIVAVLFGKANTGQTNYWDDKGDGITNPAPISSWQCNLCDNHTSTVADDDGGFLRMAVGAYYRTFPGTNCMLFPGDSIFNTDISSLPVNTQSVTWTANMAQNANLHPDLGTFAQWYGMPVNVAPPPTTSVTPTFLYNSDSDHPAEGYPIDQSTLIEGGPGAASNTDRHALVINKNLCKLYEIFNLQNFTNGQTPSAGSGATWDLSSNAMRPAGFTSADAAGLPITPLLLRPDEIQAGIIAHAIRFTAHCSSMSYIWPASHQAGSCDSTFPPMGARFRLRSSYNISSFSPTTQVVLRAFQHYGLVLADNGSDWFFSGTTDDWWGTTAGSQVVSELKTIPAAQFDAIDESALQTAAGSYASSSTTTPCAAVTASAAPPSPQVPGTTVTFTASASGCPHPVYQFWVLAPGSSTWTIAQAYSAGATLSWITTGKPGGLYRFSVWARDANGTGVSCSSLGCDDAFAAINYTLSSQSCTSVTASAAPASPQAPGTPVTVTSVASGCSNPLYQFWILAPGASTWTITQAYSTNAAFNWTTTGKPGGAYHFSVWARDAGSSGTSCNSLGCLDAFAAINYTLGSSPCALVTSSAAPGSPQPAGTAVSFTGVASGCPSPLYEFWMLAPGASTWTMARAYSSAATFNWSTTGLAGGAYRFSVWVRDSGSAGTSCNSLGCLDAYTAASYTLTSTPCASVTASPAPPSPSVHGTAVTFTGVASGCPNPLYEFWILAPGSSTWMLAQGYSTNATFNWSTTGLVAGTYHFSVWVRDSSSAGTTSTSLGTFDAFVGASYTLT